MDAVCCVTMPQTYQRGSAVFCEQAEKLHFDICCVTRMVVITA